MKTTYIILYDNYDSVHKEFREKDHVFALTAFSSWELLKAAMVKISNLYDPEQIFEFDFDDENELFSLKVHVLFGYDLYFRAAKLVIEDGDHPLLENLNVE
jgi:hypothetical protein